MKKFAGMITLAALAFAAGIGSAGWWLSQQSAAGRSTSGRKILYWVDPMHPSYKSDKPGIAPDCGMKLEPVYADGIAPEAPKTGKIIGYRDPKDPSYKSDKPGLNPATGNTLEPVYATPSEPAPGSVHISDSQARLIGVTYAQAELTPTDDSIRVNGKVAADETRITHVHSRLEGFADKVFGDFTGQFVNKGQPLLTVYSPEMYASEQEYMLALKGRDLMKSSSLPVSLRHGDSLVEASRRRLQLYALSDAQIRTLEKTGEATRDFTINAPATGFITSRNVFPNQKVTPDMDLYTIVDLSRIWVIADVFESDAAKVRLGQGATVSLPYDSGRTISGRVSYILPQVDPNTRTLKVRIEAANPGTVLKPDMFVDVNLRTGSGNRLTVPNDAVLDSGVRKVVYVANSDGTMEPREVTTGDHLADRVEIRSGLRAGERVVASGNFLIDSESQMRGATSASSSHSGSSMDHAGMGGNNK